MRAKGISSQGWTCELLAKEQSMMVIRGGAGSGKVKRAKRVKYTVTGGNQTLGGERTALCRRCSTQSDV